MLPGEFDKDVDGFANSTPSYWTPFKSIVTTNCCSPLAALPGRTRNENFCSQRQTKRFDSLTTTSYFELHSRQYRRWTCRRNIRNAIADRWGCMNWSVRYVMVIHWRSGPFIVVYGRRIVSMVWLIIDWRCTFRWWLTRNISFSIMVIAGKVTFSFNIRNVWWRLS